MAQSLIAEDLCHWMIKGSELNANSFQLRATADRHQDILSCRT